MNDSTERLLRNAMQSSYNTGKVRGFAQGILAGIGVVIFSVVFSVWMTDLRITFVRDGKVIDRRVCP